MRQDLVRAKTLWDLQFMIDSQIAVWKQLLWNDINAAALEEETKAFQKIIKGTDQSLTQCPPAHGQILGAPQVRPSAH